MKSVEVNSAKLERGIMRSQ